jgi:hypothetical protein
VKRKTLVPLLFALLALPAGARDFGSVFVQPLPLVAQMSQEERRAMRERWEKASPEERAELRSFFQERLRMTPPEQFDPRHFDMRPERETPLDQAGPSWNFGRDMGFGMGYEQRRHGERPSDREKGSRSYDDENDDRRGGNRR